MCASFMIKQRDPEAYGLLVETRIDDIEQYVGHVIRPYQMAPVIVPKDSVLVLTAMQFSLVPRWSKERKVKFATHNARLETVAEKPTWKDAFKKRHCIIPMNDFIEPIYTGEYAGNMVSFQEKSDSVLLAAGIWEEWVDKATGETLESFAIVTSDPPKFVLDIGHDRCPIYLDKANAEKWIGNEGNDSKDLLKFLANSQATLDFKVEKHRPLKPGWEKRVPK